MYDFLLQISFVMGLAIMAFVLLRALPRVPVEGDIEPSLAARFGDFLNRLPLHHVDERINGFLFKFLRRSRVFILKLDNRLVRQLDRVKKNGEQSAANPVQEMIDHVQGEKAE